MGRDGMGCDGMGGVQLSSLREPDCFLSFRHQSLTCPSDRASVADFLALLHDTRSGISHGPGNWVCSPCARRHHRPLPAAH